MKKILIFGATGNIGAYFTDYCQQHIDSGKYEIIAVGRKKTDFFKKRGIPYYSVDLRCPEDFDLLPTDEVYAVVNLAGLLPAYVTEFDPFAYIETNISGALRILEYARKNHADRAIYTQTWAEQAGYWGKSEVLSPSMPRRLLYTGDHAFYSITKSMVVDTMEHYKQEFGLKSFVFRLPNVYLYHPQLHYYVEYQKKKIGYRYMIEQAAAGHDLELWGDPEAFKDILYVKDLCQMMFKALFAPVEGGIYNAGTGVKTTLRQQIEGIAQVFSPKGKPVHISHVPGPAAFTSFVMDIENIRSDLGYEPAYTYLDYLRDYRREREEKRFNELWEVNSL